MQNKGLKCGVTGCPLPAWCQGICRGHYLRRYTGSQLGDDVPIRRRAKGAVWLPGLSLPADVHRALTAEAELRALPVAEVVREKLTALMRMSARERREAA